MTQKACNNIPEIADHTEQIRNHNLNTVIP